MYKEKFILIIYIYTNYIYLVLPLALICHANQFRVRLQQMQDAKLDFNYSTQ